MFEGGDEDLALRGREPLRLLRPVGEDEEADDAEDHRRQGFEDEEPLPSGEAEAFDLHQRPGDRRADDVGDRDPSRKREVARARTAEGNQKLR